jgi:hypothetical protein
MKWCIIYCLVLTRLPAFSQHAVVIASHYAIDYDKHSGYVQLNTGEVITGTFEYASFEFPTINLKFYSPPNKFVRRIKSTTISKVVLAGKDSSWSNKDSTYFFVLDKKTKLFYRQLSFNQEIEVFDILFNVNERPGLIDKYLVVKWHNNYIEFNTQDDFIEWIKKNANEKVNWHEKMSMQEIIRKLNEIA